jgi:hypothetical protein
VTPPCPWCGGSAIDRRNRGAVPCNHPIHRGSSVVPRNGGERRVGPRRAEDAGFHYAKVNLLAAALAAGEAYDSGSDDSIHRIEAMAEAARVYRRAEAEANGPTLRAVPDDDTPGRSPATPAQPDPPRGGGRPG